MVNFSPLTAEIGSGVWGTPANFNGFRVLASSLQRCRSTEVNKTLQNVWPSPELVHYTYTLPGLPRNGILHHAEFRQVATTSENVYSVPAQETAKHRAKFGWPLVSDIAAVTKPIREIR